MWILLLASASIVHSKRGFWPGAAVSSPVRFLVYSARFHMLCRSSYCSPTRVSWLINSSLKVCSTFFFFFVGFHRRLHNATWDGRPPRPLSAPLYPRHLFPPSSTSPFPIFVYWEGHSRTGFPSPPSFIYPSWWWFPRRGRRCAFRNDSGIAPVLVNVDI